MTGARILVVDDDPDMQDVMALALEAGDYRVCRASNGQEALERVEECLPDLILLDMRMPVMDGWAFSAELRRRHGHQVPVVVCTAAEDAQRRAREVGAVGCLSKPFELEEMLHLVESIVPRHWERASQHP
ncbi:urea transport system substrate-binding protein [Archangium gephyra]|uniref:DNA-binding response regulator KdpE n=1 Tax=Archangium gephyra TaxID=48 RepID=A0AAC8QJK8_9BACT|nr:response regulator [Archangium gephyra]AKJ08451.1 DNA-binding response regulator KdpE [Archangium gephyra]REG20549.1 urea transport system substrate-binding protein [Archangium gephyra]